MRQHPPTAIKQCIVLFYHSTIAGIRCCSPPERELRLLIDVLLCSGT